MEEKLETPPDEAVQTIDHTVDSPVSEGYVSPEVLAARNGERVEFGHDLSSPPDNA